MSLKLEFKKHDASALTPSVATPGSAGMDLSSVEKKCVSPGTTLMFDTGLTISIPRGFVGLICPRSGLAAKQGITVANAPGVIDSDYRGPLKVLLFNRSDANFFVNPGDRIAQILFVPVATSDLELQEVTEFTEELTERGCGGFGSTGRS